MSQPRTDPESTHHRLTARRPPSARSPMATVTRLGNPAEHSVAVPLAHIQGTLALDLGGLPPAPATPELHVVPTSGEQAELHTWAARFAQATVEVLGGQRPLNQLLRWTAPVVYADLERRVRVLAATAPVAARERTIRPQVRSVHVFQPGRGSAEVSVHVRHGQRSRAIAARLEEREGRWRCVVLQLG